MKSMTTPEMESTVKALLASGKGILAADESFSTIEKRFTAFDIAARARPLVLIGGSGDGPSAPSPGFIDDAPEGAYATA